MTLRLPNYREIHRSISCHWANDRQLCMSTICSQEKNIFFNEWHLNCLYTAMVHVYMEKGNIRLSDTWDTYRAIHDATLH